MKLSSLLTTARGLRLRPAALEIGEAPLPLCAASTAHPAGQLERDLRGVMRELGEARFALTEEQREQRERLRSLLLKVLDAVDVLELALRDPQRAAAGEALRSARQLLGRVLQDESVERAAPSAGEPFDPHRHRVSDTLSDATHPDGAIADVTLPGWRWHGELLRKAAVVVVRGGGPAAAQDPSSGAS